MNKLGTVSKYHIYFTKRLTSLNIIQRRSVKTVACLFVLICFCLFFIQGRFPKHQRENPLLHTHILHTNSYLEAAWYNRLIHRANPLEQVGVKCLA